MRFGRWWSEWVVTFWLLLPFLLNIQIKHVIQDSIMCDVRSDCFLSISEIRTPTIHPIPVNPSFLHSSLLSSKYPSTGFHSFPQFPSFHFTPIQQVFIVTVHSPRLFRFPVLARSLHSQRVERYLKDGNDRHEIWQCEWGDQGVFEGDRLLFPRSQFQHVKSDFIVMIRVDWIIWWKWSKTHKHKKVEMQDWIVDV